jgi:hypothetical protein
MYGSMTKPNDNQGAINALKGMRAQFLYTLYRILNASEQEYYFRPEGQYEDLEILDDKNGIIEAIQVKDLNETITLSDILPKDKDGLLKRGLNAHEMGHKAIIRLISFSDINTEVKEISKNNHPSQLIKKLKEKGLKEKDIEVLQKHFKFDVFKKDKLIEAIAQKLIEDNYFANIEITTDLLVYWIYISAEKQQTIGKDSFRDRFMNIGSFLTKRESFVNTFNHLILPLKNTIEHENIEILREEFFQGISAKYDHILADLDVKRNEKLESINTSFRTQNIVFIHGASGQGKSTLAYRFLKDYCDDNTVFEIKLPSDFATVYEVINSLEGISEGLGFPMTLYVDVTPGNKEWINLLAELSAKKNLRFLVSIREEDWHSVEVGDKFLFSEIELKLDEEEAHEIYDGLDKFKSVKSFTEFSLAWLQFGENGPLLEFVYLITQTQSLEAKIKSQIARFVGDPESTDKVELLKFVSLADSFGARIKYKEFFQKQRIKNPKQIIHLLKEEYLIQTIEDETYIIGLHPVRSKLIKRELFDPILDEEAKYALHSIPFISDNTLLDFLRNSFAHANLDVQGLLSQLSDFKPTSWQAYYQILKSLLWKGMSDYIHTNIELLDQIYERFGISWITIVNIDFAKVIEAGNMIENSDIFPQEAKTYAKEINSKLSLKETVFDYCKRWLNQISIIAVEPKNNLDWDSFGLFLFWLNHFNVSCVKINFTNFDFERLFKEYPLTSLGQIIYSLKLYNDETQEIEKQVDNIFKFRFYNEFKIFFFEEKEGNIKCKYIVDIEDENYEHGEKDIFHARTMKIVELLRLAYPSCESYAVKGYGHKFSFLPDSYDSSEKNIIRNSLPLKPLIKINSSYINLFEFQKRHKDWDNYTEELISQRDFFSEILFQLITAFKKYHIKKDWRVLNEYIQEYYEKKIVSILDLSFIPFPKIIIDEWGEFGDFEKENADIRFAAAVNRYKPFRDEYSIYYSSIKDFIHQSSEVINYKLLQLLGKEVSDYNNIARVSLGNLFELYEHIVSFQKQFRIHFEKFADPYHLKQIENKEKESITSLCFIWRLYLYDGKFITDKKNISSLVLDKMHEVKTTFQVRLKNELYKLSKEKGFNVKLDFDEKHKRCIIITDTTNIFLTSEMFQNIYEALYSAIGNPEYNSIKYLQLAANYERFYLIQLYQGNTFNNQWHEFQLYNLREKHVEELAPHSFLPSLIDNEIIKRHNIKSWFEVSEEIQILQKMVDSISIATQLGNHLIQFDELETDDSEIGLEVAKSYILSKKIRFIAQIQIAIDYFFNNEFINILIRAESVEINKLITDCQNLLFPTMESAKNRKFPENLNIKLLQQWSPRLNELSVKLNLFYLLMSSIIIDDFINETIPH